MKAYPLKFATHFPEWHPRAGEETGFALAVKHYIKIHTLRKDFALWQKRIAEVQAGQAYLSLQDEQGIEFAKLHHTHGVGVERIEFKSPTMLYSPRIECYLHEDTIAEYEGLSKKDYLAWFQDTKPQEMALIYFTDFRYIDGLPF